MSQEKQVAMDNSGKITVIDKTLEIKLRMFTEYPGFKEARLYETGENSYILEISYQPEKTALRVKKEMDGLMVLEFRNQVSETIKTRSPNALLDQSGRSSFLITSALISSLYYGTAISEILDLENYATTSLLTAGAGFFVPYALTKNIEFTMGEATLAVYGQTRGMLHGAMLPLLFDSNTEYRVALGLGLAASIGETMLGYRWAKKNKFSEGQAFATGIYSDFGMAIALGATHALGLYEYNDYEANVAALSTLAGAAGGFWLGNKLAKKDYYTSGDGIVLGGAGFLGAFLPMSLMSVAEPENPRWYTLAGTLGAVGGLMIGDYIVKKYDFSIRQGIYIYLSETAGALVGMGVGYALGSASDNPSTMAVLTGLGALAGFSFMARNYMKDINKEDSNLSFNLSLNPMGLMSMTGKSNTLTGLQGAPLVMGSIRF